MRSGSRRTANRLQPKRPPTLARGSCPPTRPPTRPPKTSTPRPIASLPATPASSSQTVPKVAKKKSAGISSLIHVFHRKRSQPSKPAGGLLRRPQTLHRKTHSPSTASLTPKDESLVRPAASAAHAPLQRLRHARTAFNFGPQHKQLLTAALALRYKRNSFPPNSRAASDPRPLLPVATRCLHDVHSSLGFLRRHTIPDMTVAAYGMVICGTDELQHRYRGRIEKVKFGVPISEAFSHDIPATLLVLLLKVNKEGPLKKDIWRAPGNQAQVRKLSHIMQHGRLVNISHISVNSCPNCRAGSSDPENEKQLFETMQSPDSETQRQVFCRVICSLSVPSQHLLVLLFGTFRIIADSAETFNTRMGPDAIGISVAPSLFHTCIHDQRQAKMEDVLRFKTASQVISKIIQGFGYTNLFPRRAVMISMRV
ncbi:RhoGAP domain protein [Aphelenchoides fujianensis]|nr:RhoGAP domain protein [Aphelenchoides fujianensis]